MEEKTDRKRTVLSVNVFFLKPPHSKKIPQKQNHVYRKALKNKVPNLLEVMMMYGANASLC